MIAEPQLFDEEITSDEEQGEVVQLRWRAGSELHGITRRGLRLMELIHLLAPEMGSVNYWAWSFDPSATTDLHPDYVFQVLHSGGLPRPLLSGPEVEQELVLELPAVSTHETRLVLRYEGVGQPLIDVGDYV